MEGDEVNRLILPLPPSQNHMYRNFTKNGRQMRVIGPIGMKWIKQAQQEARIWATQNRWEQVSRTKLIMRLWFFWPNGRTMDTHNRLKITLDALEGILYENDYYVLPQIIDFQVDKSNPRLEIELERKDVSA
jgi:crossover junction endodeoxyribonuclease RusA